MFQKVAITALSTVSFLISCISGNSELSLTQQKNVITKPVFGSDVNVTCGTNEMLMTISKEYIGSNAYWIALKDHLCLADSNCCATTVNDKVSIKITDDFSRCGNEISLVEALNSNGSLTTSHYKFTNKLVYNGGSATISRDIVLLQFHCLYEADLFVTAKPSNSAISSHVIKLDHVEGRMGVFRKDEPDESYNGSPVTSDNEEVLVKLTIEDPGFSQINDDGLQVVSVIRDCRLETTSIEYDLVRAGCPTSDLIRFHSNAISLEAEMGFQISGLVSPASTEATIRCLVDLCANTPKQSCQKECSSRQRRYAREPSLVTSDAESRQKYVLNFDGKELSATIHLRTNRETSEQFEASKIPEETFEFDPLTPKVIVDDDAVDPKFLQMWMIGVLMFVAILVILVVSILLCRRQSNI